MENSPIKQVEAPELGSAAEDSRASFDFLDSSSNPPPTQSGVAEVPHQPDSLLNSLARTPFKAGLQHVDLKKVDQTIYAMSKVCYVPGLLVAILTILAPGIQVFPARAAARSAC